MIDPTSISCGVYQLFELDRRPDELCRELVERMPDKTQWQEKNDPRLVGDRLIPFRVVIFSDIYPHEDNEEYGYGGYGEDLTIYVRANRLGKVQATAPVLNYNSFNYIQTFMWTVNWKALLKKFPDVEYIKPFYGWEE